MEHESAAAGLSEQYAPRRVGADTLLGLRNQLLSEKSAERVRADREIVPAPVLGRIERTISDADDKRFGKLVVVVKEELGRGEDGE